MSRSLPALLFVSTCVFAQVPPSPSQPQQMPEFITITPETVVATLNGRKFTAGEFERITRHLTPQMRQIAGTQPRVFLEQYAYGELVAKEAEKLNIGQIPEYRERLEQARRQILTEGLVAEKTSATRVTTEELASYYESNKAGFRDANAKVLFISRAAYVANLSDGAGKMTPIEEVKAKVDKVAKLLRDGGDFVALAREYSDDRNTAEHGADLPVAVRANSAEFPQDIRDAIFNAKIGEVVGPVEHQTGFYFFRVERLGQAPLDAVRNDIEKLIKDQKVRKWLEDQRTKATVSLDHEAFWDTFVAANKKAFEDEQRARQAAQHPVNGGGK